jgi:hypothetical protein
MWQEGDVIFAQERLLIHETGIEPFDPAKPYRQIGERETTSKDGEPISEWRIQPDDIRTFLARRGGSYGAVEL